MIVFDDITALLQAQRDAALGGADLFIIADVPDNVSAAALSLR